MDAISNVRQPSEYVRSEPAEQSAKAKAEAEKIEVKKTEVEVFSQQKTEDTKAPLSDGVGRLVDIQI